MQKEGQVKQGRSGEADNKRPMDLARLADAESEVAGSANSISISNR